MFLRCLSFRGRAISAAVSTLLCLAAPPLQAQTAGPLSLDEALGIASANAPALNAATGGAQAAREMAVSAGQLPDPVLKLVADDWPVNGPDSSGSPVSSTRRIGLMQEYVSTAKRDQFRRRAELDAVRQEAMRSSLRSTLRRDVATAWFERYYALQSQALLKVMEAEIELQLQTLDSQLRAGKASAAESPLAMAMLLQNRDRLLVADKQARISQIALTRWLGKEATRPFARAPNIDILALDPANPEAIASAAPVLAHASEREIAQADFAIAQSSKRPNWSWELGYSRGGNSDTNMVSLGVTIPLVLNASNKQDRDIAARKAQVEQADALHEDLLRETQMTLASSYAEWQSLVERRRRLADALLPVLRQRIELSLAAYRSGQGTLASVLEARRADVEAQLQLLDLARETARLWAQLNYVYGESATVHAQGAHQ